jgi:Fur family transcriptional regulator, ferric uptake regulator
MKGQKHRHREVVETVRAKARKMTGPRRSIVSVLQKSRGPRTIREIYGELGGERCDLATIYRAMHMLETVGLVKRFDFGDGSARYELIEGEAEAHHHHLVCTGCTKVVEIDECFPEELQERIAADNGFARISHRLEFFGVCPECQTK